MDYRHGFLPAAGTKGSCAALVRKQGNLGFYSPRMASDSCATYILVQFTSRRLSERELSNPERVRRMQDRALKALDEKDASGNRSNSSFGGNHYDSFRHLLWEEFTVRNSDELLIHAVSGIYLTGQGTIQI